MVLWAHAAATRGFPFKWSPDAGLGVRVFFVISGFIITRLMIGEDDRAGGVSLPAFYRRRVLRIFPALWTYILVITILSRLGYFPLNMPGDILRPLTFSFGLPCWPSIVPWQTAHCWSLAIEEQFYFVWPTVFLLTNMKWRIGLVSMVLLAGPIARQWLYQHPRHSGLAYTVVGQADMIGWGCLLALLGRCNESAVRRIISWRPGIGRVAALLAIVLAPSYFAQVFRRYPPLAGQALTLSVHAAAIAYLIASTTQLRSGILYQILNFKVLTWIGLVSYGLYIWQQVFLANPTNLQKWNTWPVNIVCAVAAATVSFVLIERPALSLRLRRI
jgi:peptidoglycan/LPS O-acetylase OafA/YrhL